MALNFLKFSGARQMLGAATGMIVATVLYVVINELPSMQIGRALLVDTSPYISTNADQIRINEKKVDSDTSRRIEARAQQVAAQLKQSQTESSEASVFSSQVAVLPAQSAAVDHADRSAWLKMREAQRERTTAYDVTAAHAAVSASPETVPGTIDSAQTAPSAFPTVQYVPPIQTAPKAALPNSGMGLHLIVFVAFLLALRALPAEHRPVSYEM